MSLAAASEILVITGAPNKVDMFQSMANQLGWDGVQIRQHACGGGVNERNDWVGPALFEDKAYQTWLAAGFILGMNLGVMNDVNPRVKSHSQSKYRQPLTKNKVNVMEDGGLTTETRGRVIADHVFDSFAMFDMNQPFDVRVTSAVGCMRRTGLEGLFGERIYTHFPTHPFPSTSAALSYVVYARENNRDVSGKPDNLRHERSAVSAGSIMQQMLARWYVTETQRPIYVDTVTCVDPLYRLEQIGSGFTQGLVAMIGEFAETALYAKKRCNHMGAGFRKIKPNARYKVEWSPREAQVVWKHVGQPVRN